MKNAINDKNSIVGNWEICEMQASDLPTVSHLAEQLGHPTGELDLRERFNLISHLAEHKLLVARGVEGKVVGWLHIYHEMPSLLGPAKAEIAALIVDENRRSQGIGSKLLAAAESWASAQGLRLVRIRSNVIREHAHRFYQREGYRIKKSWHLLTKELRNNSTI